MNIFLNFVYRPVKYAPAAARGAFRAHYTELKFGLAFAYIVFYGVDSPQFIEKYDAEMKTDTCRNSRM